MNPTIYCVCGLPARSLIQDGSYCSDKCAVVGSYMYRERAKETAWLAKQIGRTPGLQEALARVNGIYA